MQFDITPLKDWLPFSHLPLVISGPCSAESHEQLLTTARALSRIPQVRVFRAGIWKPRTRPSKFEGVGTKGLEWMREVKAETGLLTTVEVASPDHVEKSLKHGIDILWIGARTVVNPFSVQELAESLKGVDIPVMVKNPLNPDVKLWMGALERLNSVGITKLVAIHRGFYYYKHSIYRNHPMWEIPIDLQWQVPGLPIICDPSHISGRRDLLQGISQKAFDLGMSGLMIESHVHPEVALTDAEQQITPEALQLMLENLMVRQFQGDQEFETHLEELRHEIDKIDAELIDTLSKRMTIVEEIGQYKKQNNITVLQIRRWSEIIYDRLGMGERMGLSKDFLLKMLQLVHKESIRKQEEIMGQRDDDEM
ncbi:MAG: bifunctional 3-deoxy-7-phosphoheptulonate synthase/chorismate mutase type II [Bacteroidales bacterium]|nr:bifunctional 3-deoxy-7-phosphoheptulonate synthase/chorismate mutase type II [Bacteroidales bacterium]